MKKNIRLTESYLRNVIRESIGKVLKEDVLGNDWRENEEDKEVMNNYEPFESQKEDELPFGNEHNWSTQGEEEYDPTEYDPEAYMDYYDHDPNDNELYHYGNW